MVVFALFGERKGIRYDEGGASADFARLRAVMDRLVRELGALDLGGTIEDEILPNAAE